MDQSNEHEINEEAKQILRIKKQKRDFYLAHKDLPEYIERNKFNQHNQYWHNGSYRDYKVNYYQANKELLKAKSLFAIYKKDNKLNKFKLKHVKKYNILIANNSTKYFIE